jgi:exodeoxyribonuclease VII small subunit
MASKSTKEFDYTKKAGELEDVLAALQSPDILIDQATKLYDDGLKLVSEIEAYLKQAENTVHKHTTIG